MSWKGVCLRILWLWTVFAPVCGWTQVRGRANAVAGVDAAGNPQTVEAALHLMSDQAAIIFIGTVAEIDRDTTAGTVVEIHFTVEQAIRGCSSGAYTLREWAGLWTANDSRYRVGQRLLLLLHAPGVSGLSSPVGGLDGAIPLRASGTGITASDRTTASAEPVADLRWVGAKLARTVVYRASRPTKNATPAAPRSMATASAAMETDATTSDSSKPAQEAAVTTVVSMIRSWEVANNATR